MISLRASLHNLIHKGIVSAFPINDSPSLKSINTREEIFQSDYICESPKQIFDKYKIRNSFFGLTSYKEVAEDIKTQVPRNEIISKIEATQNGGLKIKINDTYLKENLTNYEKFSILSKQKKALICLPGLEVDETLEYDYFRGINIAEKLYRTLLTLNYSPHCILPVMDKIKLSKSQFNRFDPLLHNTYFDFATEICPYSDLLNFCNETFYSMKKEFTLFHRKGEANLSIISLLLYKIKFLQFKDVNFICSQNQEVLLKNTLDNFNKQNSENANSFEKINQFYFGGLLLEKNSMFSARKLNFEDQIPFEDFDEYIQLVDTKHIQLLNNLSESSDIDLKMNEILKCLDISRTSKSTQSIGTGRAEEFLYKTVVLLTKTYTDIKSMRKTHDENIPYTEFDDIGRVLSLKLLRIIEAFEDTLKFGEFEILFQYWIDLAKFWSNLLDSNLLANVNNKGLLLRNSLILYEKFFYIFFGCKKN